MTVLSAVLTLSVAAHIVLASRSTCQVPIYCPCGSTGKNITVCIENQNIEKEPCKKWSRCKSCEEGVNTCLQCEDGFEGPFCSIPKSHSLKSRKKRQLYYGRRGYATNPVDRVNAAGYCPTLDSPKLGSIRCVSNELQRSCVGKCLPGYTFENRESDEITLTCRGGVWTPLNVFPACESGGHCDLIVRGAGSFNCTTGMTGTRCDVNCAGRYTGQYFCYPGEDWEPSLPRCVRPKAGITTVSDNQPSCRCQYGGTCTSNNKCVCPVGRTGTFCERIAEPEPVTCPDPGEVANADRRNLDGSPSLGGTYRVGQSVEFTCHPGFVLRWQRLRTCLSSGQWSSAIPFCRPERTAIVRTPRRPNTASLRYCRDIGVDSNGNRLPSMAPSPRGFPQGEAVEYSCNEGFVLSGERRLFCLSTGAWSAQRPKCEVQSSSTERAYCVNLGSIPNGQVQYYPRIKERVRYQSRDNLVMEYLEGSRLEYSCNDGYYLEGVSSLICESSGFWSAEAPECRRDPERSSCRNPGPITNGRVMYLPTPNEIDPRPFSSDMERKFPEGGRLQYFCNAGHTLDGSETTLTCEATGSWSAKPPRCISVNINIMYCDNPGVIYNGGANIVSSGAVPRSTPRQLSKDDIEYPEGTVLEYFCDDGYVLKGSFSLRCLPEGYWSSDAPTCDGDCGRPRIFQTTRKILNGDRTLIGEWPWVAAISTEVNEVSRLICGGAVINARTVLTAAHCLLGADKFTLYFGKHYRYDKDDDANVLVRVSTRVIIHPDFKSSTIDSDIGLLMFDPIKFTDIIQPVCLPRGESTAANLMTGKIGYVTGWGYTERNLRATELLLARLPVLTNEDCIQSYISQNISLPMTGNMFCAGFEDAQQSACSGDSGSPLVFYDSIAARYTVEGLVSFAAEGQCGLPGRYTIFTKVFRFKDWILANLIK